MAQALRVHHGGFGRAAILEMDGSLVVHAHPQAHLIFKLSRGSASFSVDERVLSLDVDRAVAVNSWQPHHYVHETGTRPTVLALYIEPGWIKDRCGAGRFPDPQVRVGGRIRSACQVLAAELLHGGRKVDAPLVEETALELLGHTFAPDARADAGPEPAVADRRIRRSLAFMRQHVGERLDLGRLAQECGISRPHFFELFKQETRLTPSVFWNMLKMESAVAALAATRRAVGDLSFDLGFSSQGNFTRFFRHHQGVTPTDYRLAAQRRPAEPTFG